MTNKTQTNNNGFNRAISVASDNFTIAATVNAALYEHIFTLVVNKLGSILNPANPKAKTA